MVVLAGAVKGDNGVEVIVKLKQRVDTETASVYLYSLYPPPHFALHHLVCTLLSMA